MFSLIIYHHCMIQRPPLYTEALIPKGIVIWLLRLIWWVECIGWGPFAYHYQYSALCCLDSWKNHLGYHTRPVECEFEIHTKLEIHEYPGLNTQSKKLTLKHHPVLSLILFIFRSSSTWHHNSDAHLSVCPPIFPLHPLNFISFIAFWCLYFCWNILYLSILCDDSNLLHLSFIIVVQLSNMILETRF